MAQPAKLLEQYDAGVLTRHELLIRLGQAAADRAPADLAAELPADVLAEVREWSAAPPASRDRCRVHAGGFTGDAEHWERYFREESRRLYDGLCQWHVYFAGAEPNAPAAGGGM